jgi:hypothetical protein
MPLAVGLRLAVHGVARRTPCGRAGEGLYGEQAIPAKGARILIRM